jgi:dihydrofolate synthase/folylpolyglutamate synthase
VTTDTQCKSYEDALNILTSRANLYGQEFKPKNASVITELLNHPEKTFKSVHIGGTNGKGSVSLKIAKVLEYSGYKCGLFTSPHISCFRERIAINSTSIPESRLASILEEIISLENKTGETLSYFECCTLIAFKYFSEEKVDLAVIEVGLGGRLDATNIIHPILSIITSISKDHTELLGATEEEIAQEKAGIIKFNTPVLIGPRTPHEVFEAKARLLEAPLTQMHTTHPHYGLENQAIALKAMELIKQTFPLNTEAISKGIKVEPPCRFEIFKNPANINSTVVLDVAHNPDGISRLIQRVNKTFPGKTIQVALSFSANKDISKCAEIISIHAKSVFIIDVDHHRLASPTYIESHFNKENLEVLIGSPDQLRKDIFTKMTCSDILIVCGSFFVMDAIKKVLLI